MKVQSYLSFEGRAEEALEFYKKAVGAEVTTLMRMKDSPEAHPPGMLPPGAENKVMHAAFRIGDTELLASDGMCTGSAKFGGVSLTITAANDAEAQRVFAALADGGNVQMPLARTFFASSFGVLSDRFGVNWMVITAS